MARVWTGTDWTFVEDHRGEVWFDKNAEVLIAGLGPIPDHLEKTSWDSRFPGELEPNQDLPMEDQVKAHAALLLRVLAIGYTDEERETWSVQIEEAKALKADPTADVPFLAARAAARNIPVNALATRVLELSRQLSAASGAILAAQDTLLAMDPIPADYADDSYWP